jgi:LAS superfamily LD-carboxypeptidase LdcB
MYLLSFIFFIFQLLACYSSKNDLRSKTIVLDSSGIEIKTDDSLLPGKDSKKEKFDVDYIMGHFDPATHPDFVEVEIKYADREGRYLRKDTYEAFKKMYEEALKDGVKLRIISATRNFNRQKELWEGKWTGEHLVEGGENLALTTPDPKMRAMKILHYSAMPGTSRHHWGTDIDLDSLENTFFETGEGLRVYNWLVTNGPRFGFCQPYSAGRPYGYLEEKWHWSYMPISSFLTGLAKRELKNEMITGFLGSESAVLIDVVDHYVLGINKDCTR